MAQSGEGSSQGRFVYKAPAKVLLDSLVRRGLIPPEETGPLLEAARVTRRAVCLLILDLGMLDEKTLAHALVHSCNLPYMDLRTYTVDSDVLNLVDARLCRDRKILPLDRVGSALTLAMVDALDDRTVTRVLAERHVTVSRVVCVASELEEAIERHFPGAERPPEHFGAEEATKALKAARASLAGASARPARASGRSLPGWLSDDDEAPAPAAATPAQIADDTSGLPDWLTEEAEHPVQKPAAAKKPAKKKAAKRKRKGKGSGR